MGNDESLVGWVELVGIVEGLVDHSARRVTSRALVYYRSCRQLF